MTITSEPLPGATLLTICGEMLDVGSVDTFKQAIQPLVRDGAKVVLSLEHVLFVDSSALGALLMCQRMLARSNGWMRICNVTVQVRALFDLVHIQRVLPVYASVADALADTQKPA